MTDRLYYNDTYCREFTAQVLEYKDGAVRLDRSAFYPTSGGQPFDTGTLNGIGVTDVYVDEAGEVWHKTEAPLTIGENVTGKIDWERRFDHMQQHAGEHMIAGAIWRLLRGMTIGLHLGKDFSTIDVTMPDGVMRVDDDAVRMIEDDVNGDIQNDVPIRCWFPDEKELSELPLRKPPTVKEHVRIVKIGEKEMVACGGTHPSTAGQIGLVKILSVAPSRGKMRVSFVCGKRAFEDYRAVTKNAEDAALVFSTGKENLKDAALRTVEKLKETERQLRQARSAYAALLADSLLAGAETGKDGFRVVAAMPEDLDMQALRDMAERIASQNAYALLAAKNEDKWQLVFARPVAAQEKMGALLSRCARQHGGKGGGKDDLAQGSCPESAALEDAYRELTGKERESC